MLGDQEPQVPLWSYRVNLEKRVRRDHPLRRFNEMLDLSFVRHEVAHTYGTRGNKSVPPETIMRMMLLLFLDDIRSERELMRIIPERLDYMWFLGYGLDEQIPNHSVLSKARKRWGQEVFVTLFSRVVHQCVEAGLVEANKIHVDASLVDANASLASVKAIDPQMSAAIERTAREQVRKLDDPEEPTSDPPQSGGTQIEAPKEGGFSKTNLRFQSKTDPDATLTRRQGLCSRPRYKTHRVVDDAHEIITAVETTTGAVDEARLLMELVKAHEDTTGAQAHTVIADSRYGSVHNLIECQKRGLRAHLGVFGDGNRGKGRSEGIYPESDFQYQEQTNTYLCPAGQIMRARRLHPKRVSWEYVTAKGTCLICSLRRFCTRSRAGRTIHRHRDQKLLDQARQTARSDAAKVDLKRRQHLIERSFADAANLHGLKRARWRGLWKQSIQDLLIATVQNLRKLVTHTLKTHLLSIGELTDLLLELTSLLGKLSRPLPLRLQI